MPKRVQRKQRPRPSKTIRISPGQVRKRLAAQRAAAKGRGQYKAARVARDAYKPRKKDRGKLILVGVHGQRDPQKKGRKGYLAYVTSTGKVQLQHLTGVKNPFKPRKLREIEPPLKKNLRHRIENFQAARRVQKGKRKRMDREQVTKIVKAVKKTGLQGDAAARLEDFKLSGKAKGGSQVKTGGAFDFNEKAVRKIAANLKHVIGNQAGKRVFNIEVIALIELPGGGRDVVRFTVPIERGDRDALRIGGLQNFVRHKFYAFMARELGFLGYVSSGSANHIRRLADNRGAEPGEYVDKHGGNWVGNDLEVVRIISLEWRLEQAQ